MILKVTSKTLESNLKQILSKTDFLDAQQYLEARVATDLKLLKQNKRLFQWSHLESSLISVMTTTQMLSLWSTTRRPESLLELQEDSIKQRAKQLPSASSVDWGLMMSPSWPAEGSTERPLQRPQVDEGLSMHLATTQASVDASRASGMPRATFMIWID